MHVCKVLLVILAATVKNRTHELDDESNQPKPTNHADDELEMNDWDEHEYLDDEEGVPRDYYPSFMVAEMADYLLDSPFGTRDDEVQGRFLCKKCIKKYFVCKKICKGLVKLSGQITDIVPCGTTCLQRLSACCFAGSYFKPFNIQNGQAIPGKSVPFVNLNSGTSENSNDEDLESPGDPEKTTQSRKLWGLGKVKSKPKFWEGRTITQTETVYLTRPSISSTSTETLVSTAPSIPY